MTTPTRLVVRLGDTVLVIQEENGGFFLYTHEQDGRVWDSWDETADEAKRQATFQYGIPAERWIEVPEEVGDAVDFAREHLARNDLLALRWLEGLAGHGDADALWRLGVVYRGGNGVTRNYDEALRWFHLAADRGYAEAQFSIGQMYANGEGVPRDEIEASKWYRLAALQDHTGAQLYLGLTYRDGRGTPQDYASAHFWFSMAAAQNNLWSSSGAAQNKELAIKSREELAVAMSPDQLAEAQRRYRGRNVDAP